jgi:hypothetical protein
MLAVIFDFSSSRLLPLRSAWTLSSCSTLPVKVRVGMMELARISFSKFFGEGFDQANHGQAHGIGQDQVEVVNRY